MHRIVPTSVDVRDSPQIESPILPGWSGSGPTDVIVTLAMERGVSDGWSAVIGHFTLSWRPGDNAAQDTCIRFHDSV